MAQQDFDSPWKEAMVKYLPRFFEFFFPEIFEAVDWASKPRLLDKELRAIGPVRFGSKRGGPRVVDCLVELRRKVGGKSWVLVHIEVQAQRVSHFEKRMLLYHTRLFERYGKQVCSLAILADKIRNWRPERYEHKLWGAHLVFQYPACKLLDFRDRIQSLETASNPFALLTAATLYAHQTSPTSPKRRAAKYRMVRGLYRAGLSKVEIRDFFRLIDWVLRLTPELESQFWKRLEQLEKETRMPYITSVERIGRERGLAEGLEKGLEEGRAEGRRAALIDVLQARFGELTVDLVKKLESVSDLERLRELSVLAATVDSLEGFGERV